jgi:hypothetical protein
LQILKVCGNRDSFCNRRIATRRLVALYRDRRIRFAVGMAGFDEEIDLWDLQILIMRNPEIGKVVSGTGGLRKMRFARASDRIGKRGGVRVCYVHFREFATVLLVTAYGKNEADDLTPIQKKSIREYLNRTKVALGRRRRTET